MSTEFLPINHGYRFPNRFEGNLPNIFLRLFFGHSVYGLCGGMVFSSLDYFFGNCPIPVLVETSEQLDKKFIYYLWKRQQRSMPIRNYFLLFIKTFKKNRELLIDTIVNQLPKVLLSIDQGQPVPLVIIRAHNFENPTNNHQILATSYELEAAKTHLFCYDPNHPQIVTKMQICRDINSLSIHYSTGEPMRGFFINYYRAKPPYAANIH